MAKRVLPTLRHGARPGYCAWLLLLLATAVCGCARVRLPAIDPTGAQILVPGGAPLASGRTAEPVFVTPPPPPPCAAPTANPVTPAAAPPPPPTPRSGGLLCCPPLIRRGTPGQVIVAPAEVVAPVGSEVLVTAALCGEDGYLVTRQPVEFSLSQESVGNLIDVGGYSRAFFGNVYKDDAQLLSANLAKACTSQREEILPRGTPSPADDVLLLKGQAWVSVTSAAEGTSYVTAVAPRTLPWEGRRQVAKIHWVDTQWALPAPSTGPAGQPQTLVTRVNRRSTSGPATGWNVRYQILDGPPAVFQETQQQVAVVPVDGQGAARVTVLPQSQQPGTNRVLVQILRPATSGALEVPLGQGETSVSWSSPGIGLRVTGPDQVIVGGTAVYQLQVFNPGDQVARGVTAAAVIPPNLTLRQSSPAGRVIGNRVEWDLGELAAQQQQIVRVECEATRGGFLRFQAEARAEGDLRAAESVQTNVFASGLDLRVEGPQTARVGDVLPYTIRLSNLGDQTLTNLTLEDAFDPGLRHQGGGVSPIINDAIGNLAPGQTKTIGLAFVVAAAGRHCHRLRATAARGDSATAEACVDAVAAQPQPPAPGGAGQPQLRVSKTGPNQMRVNEVQDYFIELENTGNVILRNVRIVDQYSDSLRAIAATRPLNPGDRNQLQWLIPELEPGKRAAITVRCRAISPGLTQNQVFVSTAEGISQRDQVDTEILGPAAGGRAAPPTPIAPAPPNRDNVPDQPPAGEVSGLRLNVASAANPAAVGRRFSFVVTLENLRDADDNNVVLKVRVPDGLQIQNARISGPARVARVADNVITFEPILTLRRRESLREFPFRIEVEPLRAGEFTVRAEATSLRNPVPATGQAQVTVNP